eukprot:GHVL01027787.1.p1 GENE.GHVL01027787.1~~GHVL01027787.1.p1  ORF type:complete len:141 (+),score=26.48 GHVL01027787.1:172-594(+)
MMEKGADGERVMMERGTEVWKEERIAEAQKIKERYPDRYPVICEKALYSDLPDLQKKKFLVTSIMTIGEFKYIMQKHINQHMTQTDDSILEPDKTIYLYVANTNTSPTGSALLIDLYNQYKNKDGFLYLTYTSENTLGSG